MAASAGSILGPEVSSSRLRAWAEATAAPRWEHSGSRASHGAQSVLSPMAVALCPERPPARSPVSRHVALPADDRKGIGTRPFSNAPLPKPSRVHVEELANEESRQLCRSAPAEMVSSSRPAGRQPHWAWFDQNHRRSRRTRVVMAHRFYRHLQGGDVLFGVMESPAGITARSADQSLSRPGPIAIAGCDGAVCWPLGSLSFDEASLGAAVEARSDAMLGNFRSLVGLSICRNTSARVRRRRDGPAAESR